MFFSEMFADVCNGAEDESHSGCWLGGNGSPWGLLAFTFLCIVAQVCRSFMTCLMCGIVKPF